jgi:hypothetical protein
MTAAPSLGYICLLQMQVPCCTSLAATHVLSTLHQLINPLLVTVFTKQTTQILMRWWQSTRDRHRNKSNQVCGLHDPHTFSYLLFELVSTSTGKKLQLTLHPRCTVLRDLLLYKEVERDAVAVALTYLFILFVI